MVNVDPRVITRRLTTAAVLCGLVACGNTSSAPAPTRVRPALTAPPAERTGPFRSPRLDAPKEREGDQLSDDDLLDTLTLARAARKDGKEDEAILLLRKCANKIKPSGVCEADLATILLPLPQFKAEALYYLDQACLSDDPAMDADLYMSLGEVASAKGRSPSAAAAFKHAIDRGKNDAATWARYAAPLQNEHETLPLAIEALTKAYELDGAQHDWLFERAVLVAQLPEHQQAADLMQKYLKITEGQDPQRDASVRSRIEELRQLAAEPPPAKAPAKPAPQ